MRLVVVTLILSILPHLAWPAAPQSRPLAGIGILRIRPPFPEQASAPSYPITLYREPGIGRIGAFDVRGLLLLTQAKNSQGEYLLTVTRKKGDWARVIYDESGNEGWLIMNRHSHYHPWQRYLSGREVRLLAGLRKEYYQLKSAPSAAASIVKPLTRQTGIRAIEVNDSWLLVIADNAHSGWIRWRDDDGRLMVSVE